jgi:hypothetical protein
MSAKAMRVAMVVAVTGLTVRVRLHSLNSTRWVFRCTVPELPIVAEQD